MAEWPEDDGRLNFFELTEPVVKLVRQAYSMRRKAVCFNKGLDWEGPSLPKSLRATCFEFDEAVNAKHLRYDNDEQGRDPLTVIIGIAVQLGIEQGRRLSAEEIKRQKTQLDILYEASKALSKVDTR